MAPRDVSAVPREAPAVDNGDVPWIGGKRRDMRLTLFVRQDCHLCAEMHRELLALGSASAFGVEVVDIDADADLVARYGHKVPVLVGDDEEICHYFLDEHQLAEYLSRAPKRSG